MENEKWWYGNLNPKKPGREGWVPRHSPPISVLPYHPRFVTYWNLRYRTIERPIVVLENDMLVCENCSKILLILIFYIFLCKFVIFLPSLNIVATNVRDLTFCWSFYIILKDCTLTWTHSFTIVSVEVNISIKWYRRLWDSSNWIMR